jgi:hypothetical protein
MSSLRCSMCSAAVGADGVGVCGACHQRAGGGGGPPVRATGEFMVPPMPSDLGDDGAVPGAPGGCSWCGKQAAAVQKLLGNGTVAICNECVSLCADVLDAELGTWRS